MMSDVFYDHLTAEGARRDARRLQDFWLTQGYRVETIIRHDTVVGRGSVIGVRSDMIAGWPRAHPMVSGLAQ